MQQSGGFNIVPGFSSNEGGSDGGIIIYEKKVSLSSAQILTLNSNPVVLIDAPGSGKMIDLISAVGQYNFNTVTYTTNTNLSLFFEGSTVALFVWNNSLINQTFSRGIKPPIAFPSGTNPQYLQNTPIIAQVVNGNPTEGDGTVDLFLTYSIIEL